MYVLGTQKKRLNESVLFEHSKHMFSFEHSKHMFKLINKKIITIFMQKNVLIWIYVYLLQESCTLELHQSFGQDFSTIAACQLTFKEIFDKAHGRIHGTASLTGVHSSGSGIGFGSLEYWVRLRVPMDQALRLYKVC